MGSASRRFGTAGSSSPSASRVREDIRLAISELPKSAWTEAMDADREPGDGAQVADLTEWVDLSGWPRGIRMIVQRELPHPAPVPPSTSSTPGIQASRVHL